MLVVVAIISLAWNPVEGIFNRVKPSLCFLEKDNGPCVEPIQRYYYNSNEGICKEFSYGGCGGNENNFMTVADCQKKCSNVCTLPPKPGPCEGAFPAYYFSTAVGKCVFFKFGGCQPNANNFKTIEACRRHCPDTNPFCMEGLNTGSRVNPNHVVRWAFSSLSWVCVPFVYNGRGGNNNNFMSEVECEAQCPVNDLCEFPADSGPCDSYREMWHFDAVSQECILFKYGGCLGNDNKFQTKEACELRCLKKSICGLPLAGKASASKKDEMQQNFDRFFYDTKTKKCRFFKYSGTGGNANNFRSVEECELYCPVKSVCVEKTDFGTGTGSNVWRWHYDISQRICTHFAYSGEGGNGNNFVTKQACQDFCIGCGEDSDRGSCLSFQPRYFYNSSSRACQNFIYGGCGGNKNRFQTFEECNQRCQ